MLRNFGNRLKKSLAHVHETGLPFWWHLAPAPLALLAVFIIFGIVLPRQQARQEAHERIVSGTRARQYMLIKPLLPRIVAAADSLRPLPPFISITKKPRRPYIIFAKTYDSFGGGEDDYDFHWMGTDAKWSAKPEPNTTIVYRLIRYSGHLGPLNIMFIVLPQCVSRTNYTEFGRDTAFTYVRHRYQIWALDIRTNKVLAYNELTDPVPPDSVSKYGSIDPVDMSLIADWADRITTD